MRSVVSCLVLIASFLFPALSKAETADLVMIGPFDRSFGQIGGGKTYIVNCDQAANECLDNRGNISDFGEPLAHVESIVLCEEGVDPNCIELIEINIRTSEPYEDVFLDFQRAGCEFNQLDFDNNKRGDVPAPGAFVGLTAVDEGDWADIRFAVGRITPKKIHTLHISSPVPAPEDCTQGSNSIAGIRLFGTPGATKP